MSQDFQRFAWVDALLSNWDGIRVRIGSPGAAFERDLSGIMNDLAAATNTDAVAVVIDRLLDLVDGTPASEYVRELLSRADVSGVETERGVIGDGAVAALVTGDVVHGASALAQAGATAPTFREVPVFFATNRVFDPARPQTDRFLGAYAPEVTYGQADVTIPARHKVGKLETPLLGSPRKSRHVVLDGVRTLGASAFATEIGRAVAASGAPELLVFVHGYNVTFEEAARRAAQFTYDMGFPGVVVLFSWPSAGAFARYFADEDSAAKSAQPLATFLRALEGGPWTRVHVVAHSMGNRVVVSSLAGQPPSTLPLGRIALVAGDIDTELFAQHLPALRDVVARGRDGSLSAYATNADRALMASRWFHKTTRLGQIVGEPFHVDGLDTIDATAVDSSLLGHTYFGQQRSVLTDLGLLVREGLGPSARGLRPVQKWWAFPA